MNSRIKLRLRNPAPTDTYISPLWLTGSDLYFDTDDSFSIALTKEIQTLTDINKITVETALDTSLPATKKNLGILGISMDIESMDNTYPEHEVELDLGLNILNQNKLRVLGYDKPTNRIEIELIDDTENWIVKLKEIFLGDLNFGTFEYTQPNIIANWETEGFFNDGDPGYFLGHVFYGRYSNPGVLSEGDLRPLIHAKKVLDLTSVAIGKKLSCPLLETDYGRRIVTYIIKQDFLKDEAALTNRKFKAEIRSTSVTNLTKNKRRKIPFPIEIEDTGNNYDASTGIFTGAGVYDFTAQIALYLVFDSPGLFGGRDFFDIELVNEHTDGSIEVLDSRTFDNGNDFHIYNDKLTLTCSNVLVLPGEKVYVSYNHSGGNIRKAYINKEGKFFNEPISTLIQPGDVIDIGSNLRHDLVLDYLKGLCHLFKFMIYDDKFSNTIYFLTPFDIDFFGDSIGGYFNSTQKDWKNYQVVNTEKFIPAAVVDKNRLYSFKRSTDAKVVSLKLPDQEPLYSRFIDNGFDHQSEMETFENPYFEPTFMNGDPSYAGTGLEVLNAGQTIPVPYMVDNLDGQFSFNIAPRILIAYGYTPLYFRRVYDDGSYSANELEYHIWNKSNVAIKIPYVAQVAVNPTSITGAAYPNPTFNVPDAKIAYGHYSDDLYQMIYKKYDRDLRDLPTMTMKVVISDDQYISEDFRNRALINSSNLHTGDVLGRVVRLASFDPEKRLAEITFIADNQISDDCIGFEVPNECKNYPTLTITQVGTVYTLTRTGTVASAVASTTFKWKYKQAFTWNTSNSVNTPIDNVEIIMIVEFSDGCPPISIPGFILVKKNPQIEYSKTGDILAVSDNQNYILTVDTTTITYSYDGINYKLYPNDGIDLNDSEEDVIYFHIKTTFTEVGSEPAEEDFTYSIAMHEDECPNPDNEVHPPSLIATKVKTGATYGYSLYKIGTYSGMDAIDTIKFREKGKYQAWVDYDNRVLAKTLNGVPVIWEAQRVIIWCTDKGCPPYCTPIIEIDGSDCGDTLPAIDHTPTSETAAHEQKWEHPDTPGLNEWKVEPLDDEIYHVPLVSTFIEQTIGMSTTNLNELNYIWDRWNFKTEYIYTWNIDYKINEIQLHLADSGGIGAQITVPIDFTYTSGDSNNYLKDGLEAIIHEYLNSQDYVHLVNYYLIVSVTGSSTKSLKISFVAKHNPTDTWIGIYAGTDQMETESPTTVLAYTAGTKAEFQITTTSAPIVENYSPYGTQFKVRLKVNTVNYFLDDSASNFNLFVALSPCPIVDEMMSAAITDTGKKYSIIADMPSCPNDPTWIWMYAGLEKGGSGDILGYEATQIVYTNVIQDIKIIGSCPDTNYCNYEKLIRLTP